MIIDVSGIVLVPGDRNHRDAGGNPIECCRDECNHYLDCFPEAARRENDV